jgi:hypothetical protein
VSRTSHHKSQSYGKCGLDFGACVIMMILFMSGSLNEGSQWNSRIKIILALNKLRSC